MTDVTNDKGFKLVSLNIRSLDKHYEEIECNFGAGEISVICLCETWLCAKQHNDLYRLPGYKIYRNDRKARKRGGGLVTYIKGEIKCDSQSYEHLNISNQHLETLIVKINLPQTKPIIIINTYRPPSGKAAEAIDKLQEIIDNVPRNSEIYILGDLNIDLLAINSPSFKKVQTFTQDNNLKQMIQSSTRITKRSASLIDHIYTNSSYIKNSGTINLNISDHVPIYIIRKKMKETKLLTSFTCRKLKYFDIEVLKEKLLEYNWTELYNSTDPNIGWTILITHIRNILDQLYPLKEYKNVRVKASWLNSEIFEIMKLRDESYMIARTTHLEDDWKKAKEYRNTVNSLCKTAKKEFIKNKIDKNTSNPSKFWKEINKLWGSKKTSNDNTIILKDENTNKLIDENNTADYLNKYFSMVGDRLQQQIAPLDTNEKEILHKNSDAIANTRNVDTTFSFSFKPINTEELQLAIGKIDQHKNSGIKNISSFLFKKCIDILLFQFKHILNSSLLTGTFPDIWKHAIITPLWKAKSKSSVKNYRPIVCLPLPGKIL